MTRAETIFYGWLGGFLMGFLLWEAVYLVPTAH